MSPAIARAAAGEGDAAADGVLLRPQRRPHGRRGRPRRRARRSSCPTLLKPLATYKDDLLVLSGLAQDKGFANGDGPGDHARGLATFLTGVQPLKTDGANIHVGVSVDQVAAQAIGKKTRFASLELGIDRGGQSGNCDSGYSCAYSSNISWRTATTPMAKEINPRLVFERLFADRRRRPAAPAATSTA